MLSRLFPNATLTRSREDRLISRAGPGAIVFDVGDVYDPDALRFDHHQADRPLRSCGLPYSAFGLVWRHFGRAYVARLTDGDRQAVEEVHAAIDRDFVRQVDAGDNRVPGAPELDHPMTFALLVEDMRPDFDTPSERLDGEMEAAFLEAARFAGRVLDNKIRQAAAQARARSVALEALDARSDPRWIELPADSPAMTEILRDDPNEILFALLRGHREWLVRALPPASGPDQPRKPMPRDWASLRGPDLVAATGIEDAVFCHGNRHVAVARSREGAIALIERALKS